MARPAQSGVLKEKIGGYTVLFEPAEEGGYTVTCPALPGLVTEGNSLRKARMMAEDAIAIYCESLRADGLSLPEDAELDHWRVTEIKRALREADAGDFASDEAVKAFIGKWRRPVR